MGETRHKLGFKGNGGTLFGIYFVNMLLTAVTFGIYSFWAQVKIKRFFYQNTYLMDQPFDYHGTGEERFIGFLKGIGIVITYIVALTILTFLLSAIISPEFAAPVVTILGYLGVVLAIPFMQIGRHKYMLTRSSWRNIRFNFTGSSREFFMICLKGVLLTIVTLGIYYPWFYCNMQKFLIQYSSYGTEKFDFHGEGRPLFFIHLKGYLLTIVTLGIFFSWYQARIIRYYWNNVSIQGKNLKCEIRGEYLFLLQLVGIPAVIFTLGLAIPWISIWAVKMLLESISVDEGLDFSAVKGVDVKGSALADGLNDASEAIGAVLG